MAATKFFCKMGFSEISNTNGYHWLRIYDGCGGDAGVASAAEKRPTAFLNGRGSNKQMQPKKTRDFYGRWRMGISRLVFHYCCADMDYEMPALMGISDDILENDIFVHQDAATIGLRKTLHKDNV
ncbi:hypothetical protein Tco_0494664 [Tanacetum coccineum]